MVRNEVDTFAATARLRRFAGMRGYGVYHRLTEICNAAPGKWAKYDLEDFAYDMKEEQEFIRKIAEDYDLFVISDGKIADAFTQTAEAKERERQEQIHKNRSEAAKKAAATRKANALAAQAQNGTQDTEKTGTPIPPSQPAVKTTANDDLDGYVRYTPEQLNSYKNVSYPSDMGQRLERAKNVWNEVFRRKNPRRVVNNLVYTSLLTSSFRQVAEVYTDADIKDAIEQASREKFTWQFQDVLKPANIQRLLSNLEAERQQAAKANNNDEEITPEVKELIEFGDKMGWIWNNG